jgi:uncharacterized UBP type Zn finger protein
MSSPDLPIIQPMQETRSEMPVSSEQCCMFQWIGRIWNWIRDEVFAPIARCFQIAFTYCCNSTIPIAIDDQTRARILEAPTELAKAQANVVSKKLINLTCTCYLNATLQMIASLNAFNGMLTTPIPLPQRENFPTDDDYQRALRVCENMQLLKGHLAAIIHKMRNPDKTDLITLDHLSDLFCLLQVCGWRKQFWQQQDPHEFLMFLRNALNEQNNLLQVVSSVSYSHEGITRTCLKTEAFTEVSLGIPKTNALRDRTCTSMQNLIESSLEEDVEGYRPSEQSNERFTAHKKFHFLSPPPNVLFFQEKRFGWNENGPHRISTAVPQQMNFDPMLSIPFHTITTTGEQEEVTENETKQYRLKAVVCHHGGTDSSSGHYTAIVTQLQEEKEIWMHYNDAQAPKGFFNTAEATTIPTTISNKIKTDGYYLAYELVDDASDLNINALETT